MFGCQSTRANRLAMVALTVSVVASFATSPAFAAIAIAVNDLVARVSDDGRHIVLGGVLLCDAAGAGDQVKVYVTVTQRQGVTIQITNAAIAEGSTQIVCTGDFVNDRWEVRATTQGDEEILPGTVTFSGLAVSRNRNETTDAFQWHVERLQTTPLGQ